MEDKNDLITENEIKEIEKIEIDSVMLEKVKKGQKNSIKKIFLDEVFEKVNEKLDLDENIEFHVIGRDYSSESKRRLCAIFMPRLSHPIIGWSAKNILIKTNKRLFLVEASEYLKFSDLHELKGKIYLYKEKENFYFSVESADKKRRIIEFDMEKFDLIMESFKDSNETIVNKKIRLNSKYLLNTVIIVELVAAILFIIYYIVNMVFK